MMCAASDFTPASELPPSASREEQLEALVRTQAIAIERMERLLDSPQQAGPKMSSQEKAAIIQALSTLEGRIKALELTVTKLQGELKTAQDAVKQSGQEVYDVHELARYSLKTLSVRCTALEDLNKPRDTARNQAHINAIWGELLRRQKAGMRGITYKEAAKLCKVDKSVIKRLHTLIAADSRFDIIWHPGKKNTKLICLKNYK